MDRHSCDACGDAVNSRIQTQHSLAMPGGEYVLTGIGAGLGFAQLGVNAAGFRRGVPMSQPMELLYLKGASLTAPK